ncbi:hypothetical protein GEMRC1_011762 [Eukaryota sp. GEM-RC1]
MLMTLYMILAPAPFIAILRKTSQRVEPRQTEEPGGVRAALKAAFRIQMDEPFIRDFFWIFFSWFFISLTITFVQTGFLFPLIFEVASAYGTVGLSLGFPGFIGGFSAVLPWTGKVFLMITMLAGRHRGLPY